jgi:hypothetical protein
VVTIELQALSVVAASQLFLVEMFWLDQFADTALLDETCCGEFFMPPKSIVQILIIKIS